MAGDATLIFRTGFEARLKQADERAFGIAFSILKNVHDAREAVSRAYDYIGRHPRLPESWEKYEQIVCTTTKQRALDMLRSRKTRREVSAEGDSIGAADDQPVLNEVMLRERALFIREATQVNHHAIRSRQGVNAKIA